MNLSKEQLLPILNDLRDQPAENEVFEFKEANRGYDFTKIGRYFSALSNEANLKGQPFAWLVFGVKDNGRTIIGSSFRTSRADLDSLKSEIANKITNRITFMEIYELNLAEGRVVMFQVPAAPQGIPIAFDGHYYGRDGQELSPLNLEEIERIRSQATREDWSAMIIPDAELEDLDPKAILKARENFKGKFPELALETDTWDDLTFLNKAKLTIKGKITRTAILLLGREESEHFVTPSDAKIRWILKDQNNIEKDYEIVNIPFLLAVDKVFSKIRNLTYRYLKEGTLFPDEVLTYEPFIIREALNNCIAHQDYTKCGRINAVEFENGRLVFSNYGDFIPGSVEKVIKEDAPQQHYRNPFLAIAMFNLRMVDTIGGGIKKMFIFQSQRYFPMPEYDLSDNNVKVTITGKVLDLDFARILARNPDLTLNEIICLDKVQKRKPVQDKEIITLKKKGMISGRKPNYFLSDIVLGKTGDDRLKAQYIKHRGFDDEYYKNMILEYLRKYKEATRKDLETLLIAKLPEILNEQQKQIKLSNLLASLRKRGKIQNIGTVYKSRYALV
ncbi:MAG: putative DNA binding domain-containing protein [Candidatus Aminicenantes bacterium]|nr:putative DNA binding domain-containing protein [Candidatus Aminicenantes bacterium]